MQKAGDYDLKTYMSKKQHKLSVILYKNILILILSNYKKSQIERLFLKVINCVKFFHSKGVIHRDIKLENIMVTLKRKIRFIDFGSSSILQKDKRFISNFGGTPVYMAPEIIKKLPFDGDVN